MNQWWLHGGRGTMEGCSRTGSTCRDGTRGLRARSCLRTTEVLPGVLEREIPYTHCRELLLLLYIYLSIAVRYFPTLPGMVYIAMRPSPTLPSRVYIAVIPSPTLPSRVCIAVRPSPALPGRVYIAVRPSPALSSRVHVAVRLSPTRNPSGVSRK